MTFGAVAGFVIALMLVLGLFALAMRAVRRFAGVTGGATTALPLVVLQRIAIGPRQGLAIVRVGDRALVVSVGDGGVRRVSELTPDECVQAGVITDEGDDDRPSTRGQSSFTTRLRSSAGGGTRGLFGMLRSLLLGVLPLILLVTAARAQTPARTAPSPTTNAVVNAAANAIGQQLKGGAPTLNLQLGNGDKSDLHVSGTVGTVLFIGLLAMLPTLLLLMTSFTRVLIVLQFLRQAIGTQNAPPGHLLAGLALLLTGFIMAPTLADVNTSAVQPWLNGQIDEGQMIQAGVLPFRTFMLDHTPEDALANFVEMSGQDLPDRAEQVTLPVLVTAFATNELKNAFQMGFALFLPFVVIDLVVSAVLTSMGMFMLPPTMIALPCKLLLFVLVDGWSLIVGSLIASFH
jgi:flagellar biosynthesis protein FliP